MAKDKKTTITRKLSARDYANLINYFETGEQEMDLSECDPTALAKVEIRTMRLTQEQKEKMDSFLQDLPFGISAKSFVDSLPKVGSLVVPSIAQKAPAESSPKNTQPEMILPGEEVPAPPARPKNLPHWIKNKAEKIEPANIDSAEVVRILENGEETLEAMRAKFEDLGCERDNNLWLLAADPCDFEEELGDNYRYCAVFDDVLVTADKKHTRYVEIMTEAPPTDEENFDRYFTYVLNVTGNPTQEKFLNVLIDSDEVTSVSENKIVFDNDETKTFEYENAEDMEVDFLNAVSHNRINKEAQVDIFGKKISAVKIAQKLYKKHPHGLPGKSKFYHTRKEAFEDGALEL